MSDVADDDLYRRAAALLEPGEIELHGAIIHTDITNDAEPTLHQVTIEIGDIIAEMVDAEDTYVYSGTDDVDFGLNQHQGLTIEGDEFVWECQQLLRDQTFDVVFYWEAGGQHHSIIAAIRDAGHDAVGVTEDGVID
jgi:hypothetical protein